MKSYQLKAQMALAAYRRGDKTLAHYMWELAKAEFVGGGE